MSYRAVFFDLFDTLVLFHRDRLPEISVNGRTMRTTAGRLHAAFRDYAPDVALPAGYPARDAIKLMPFDAAKALAESDAARKRFGAIFE